VQQAPVGLSGCTRSLISFLGTPEYADVSPTNPHLGLGLGMFENLAPQIRVVNRPRAGFIGIVGNQL
jgi:hypothetical protein